MEAEANFAAGALLFLGDRFIAECKDCTPSIETVQALKKRYGNTLTTTLWRMIEHAGEERPIIGFIGQHPNEFHNEKPDFRHMIPSPAFARMFEMPGIEKMKSEIRIYCHRRRGPLGAADVVLSARNGSRHEFRFETFWNGYDALTLGVHARVLPTVIIPVGWADEL